MHTVLVLGGYGFFGIRICEALAKDPSIRVVIGGRNAASARAAAHSLDLDPHSGVEVDAQGADLPRRLAQLGVNTLVHTAGPFQGQNYAVARAAVEAECNYVDLADGRQFVVGIESLHQEAVARGVTVISGWSRPRRATKVHRVASGCRRKPRSTNSLWSLYRSD